MKWHLVFFVPILAPRLIPKRESEAVYGWTEDAKSELIQADGAKRLVTDVQPGSALFSRAQRALRCEWEPRGSERSAAAQGGEGVARPGHPRLKTGPPLPHHDLRPAQPL